MAVVLGPATPSPKRVFSNVLFQQNNIALVCSAATLLRDGESSGKTYNSYSVTPPSPAAGTLPTEESMGLKLRQSDADVAKWLGEVRTGSTAPSYQAPPSQPDDEGVFSVFDLPDQGVNLWQNDPTQWTAQPIAFDNQPPNATIANFTDPAQPFVPDPMSTGFGGVDTNPDLQPQVDSPFAASRNEASGPAHYARDLEHHQDWSIDVPCQWMHIALRHGRGVPDALPSMQPAATTTMTSPETANDSMSPDPAENTRTPRRRRSMTPPATLAKPAKVAKRPYTKRVKAKASVPASRGTKPGKCSDCVCVSCPAPQACKVDGYQRHREGTRRGHSQALRHHQRRCGETEESREKMVCRDDCAYRDCCPACWKSKDEARTIIGGREVSQLWSWAHEDKGSHKRKTSS